MPSPQNTATERRGYCGKTHEPNRIFTNGLTPSAYGGTHGVQFKDGTNIAPGGGHMQQVTLILDGPEHHVEEWTYLETARKASLPGSTFTENTEAVFLRKPLQPCPWI